MLVLYSGDLFGIFSKLLCVFTQCSIEILDRNRLLPEEAKEVLERSLCHTEPCAQPRNLDGEVGSKTTAQGITDSLEVLLGQRLGLTVGIDGDVPGDTDHHWATCSCGSGVGLIHAHLVLPHRGRTGNARQEAKDHG